MASIQFFTDEDVYGAVAAQLRNSGFDAVSTPDVDRLGTSDASQLAWAAQENRVLVTSMSRTLHDFTIDGWRMVAIMRV